MSAQSRLEAQRVFDQESKPVSWAWRNPKPAPAPNPVFIPLTKSSRDYWRDKFAKDTRFANDTRNASCERQDALQRDDWVAVRCGYG